MGLPQPFPAAQPSRAGGRAGPHLPASEGLPVSSRVYHPVCPGRSSHHLSLCLSVARSQASHQDVSCQEKNEWQEMPPGSCQLGLTGPPKGQLTRPASCTN